MGDLIGAVLERVKEDEGENCLGEVCPFGKNCRPWWCPDYTQTFDERVGTSYLRRVGINGQGGFAIYARGETSFDSLLLDDLSFFGQAAYDVVLNDDGLAKIEVAAGPQRSVWDCSASPLTYCPRGQVRDEITKALRDDLPKQLNETLADCSAAPVETIGLSCATASECSSSFEAAILANSAREQADNRGLGNPERFRAALLAEENWRCAPVSEACGQLLGSTPSEVPVCQIELRARDLVPMPDTLSLVWYQGDPGSADPNAAEALYLGLQELGRDEELEQLCTPWDAQRTRGFARVSR